MIMIDWIIISIPPLIVAWALLFGGIKLLIQRVGNPNLAIGLFGVTLCWAAAAAYTFLLTDVAKQMMSSQTKVLLLIGGGNLLLAIWSYFRPRQN